MQNVGLGESVITYRQKARGRAGGGGGLVGKEPNKT